VIFFVLDVTSGGGVVAAVGQSLIIGIVAIAISFKISRTIIARRHRHS
jgi:broad specificity polyphosphatase/5'/3'-nucleotidase SurE